MQEILPYLLGAGGLISLLVALFQGKKVKKVETAAKAEVKAVKVQAAEQHKVDAAAVESANVQVKQVEEANEVRDTLQSDPTAVERVRSRFQRD
jgi:hypothetical protein